MTYFYLCRTCGCRIDAHPRDPKLDPVVLVLVDAKRCIYEFACTRCTRHATALTT